LHLHPYWRERYGLSESAFPVSTAAYRAMVSLPIYSKMDDATVEQVVAAVRAALDMGRSVREMIAEPAPQPAARAVAPRGGAGE
jgi:hypothetical protein